MPPPSFSDDLPLPFRYLSDFKNIEERRFGTWRIPALIFWFLIAALSLIILQVSLEMQQQAVSWFIHVDIQLMSNLPRENPSSPLQHYIINIPLVKPAGYSSFAFFIVALLMTLKALFHKTVVVHHSLPENKT